VAPNKKKKISRRAELDKERALELSKDSEFLGHLEDLRQLAGIPNDLKSSTDMWKHEAWVSDESRGDFVEMIDSRYLDGRAERKIRDAVDSVIEKMVTHYKLPFYFDDWIRHGLLYRTFPKVPTDPMSLTLRARIMEQVGKPVHYLVDEGEKRWAMLLFRLTHGLPLTKGGRIAAEQKEAYNQFKASVEVKQKNNFRRSRTFQSALKVKDSMQKAFIDQRPIGEPIVSKKRYTDVAGELYPVRDPENPSTLKYDRRIANRLRQRKHRLLERSKRFLE